MIIIKNTWLNRWFMLELEVYKKKVNAEIDTEFQDKKKFGDVYASPKMIFVKKGLKWYMVSINKITKAQIIAGSRQLRQCCGAPIYPTKILLLTANTGENLYLNVEETENGDFKRAEALIEFLKQNHQTIEFL